MTRKELKKFLADSGVSQPLLAKKLGLKQSKLNYVFYKNTKEAADADWVTAAKELAKEVPEDQEKLTPGQKAAKTRRLNGTGRKAKRKYTRRIAPENTLLSHRRTKTKDVGSLDEWIDVGMQLRTKKAEVEELQKRLVNWRLS
jgi:hypothetical protein